MTDGSIAGTAMASGPAPVPASVLADAGAATAAFLRLASGPEGDGAQAPLLARLAGVAIGMAEAFLGVALIARSYEDVLAADGAWRRLAAEPVRAIAGVTALPPDAAPFVLPVAAYRVDIAADGRGWVRVTAGGPVVAVAYGAGLAATWADVPAPVAHGVVVLAARLFADRGADSLPAEVAALWRPFRRLRLFDDRAGGGR